MITLFTDLDNTIIYPTKKVEGMDNVSCIELRDGEPISYIFNSTKKCLIDLMKEVQIIPITTRGELLFNRVDLPKFKYALINNGGSLLINGVVDDTWLSDSYKLTNRCKDELIRLYHLLDGNSNIDTLKFTNDLFVYAICNNIDEVYDYVDKVIDKSRLYVFRQGRKLYMIPKGMSKGDAIARFKKRFGCDYIVSAGDEVLDFSMADNSDIFLTSNSLCNKDNCIKFSNTFFSDEIINYVKELV